MRPLLVVLLDEAIEAALLLEKIFGRWFGGFFLQRQMHALMAPVLLRVSRLDALDADSQPQLPPFTEAFNYVRERRLGLEIFLTDPDVSMDTNHLERNLRAIPMGRKNWNFCWTELGAKHVGIVQSLIVTCRLHGIDVYIYLVDILQRVGQHPAARVAEFTPRLWKTYFAGNPLRSDLSITHG
jgi:hypothetical protein